MLAQWVFVAVAAAADVAGAAFVTKAHQRGRAPLRYFVAAGAGFMLAAAFVRMLPESMQAPHAFLFVLVGYFGVHLFEHAIAPHFHFGEETHSVSELVSMSALVGLLMHTFVDGVAVASGLRVSNSLGALVFVAVLLHKFPEGLAISSLFLAAGAKRRTAILAAAALGLSTVAGVLLTDHLPLLRQYGLAVSAGVTLYVGASNLVPELQDRPGVRIPLSFVAGCGLYLAARTLVSI